MPKNGFSLAEPSSHCPKFGETATRICFGAKQYFILIENLHLELQTNCPKFGETRISFKLTKRFSFSSSLAVGVQEGILFVRCIFQQPLSEGCGTRLRIRNKDQKNSDCKTSWLVYMKLAQMWSLSHVLHNPEHLKHSGKRPKLSPGLGMWNFEDENGIEWRCIYIDYILSLYE